MQVLSNKTLPVKMTNMVSGVMGNFYTYNRSVAVVHGDTGDYISIDGTRYYKTVVEGDTATLYSQINKTPAGNPIQQVSIISRYEYEMLVKKAQIKFPYRLKLREEYPEFREAKE